MNKRMRILIPLVVLGGVAAWYFLRDGGAAPGLLSASGTVEATDADLGFQAPGRVLSIPVREGDAVTAGQELGRLDARELEAALANATAQLAAAQARLAELQRGARPQELATAEATLRSADERVQEARRNAERARTLFDGGAISREAMDRAETALEVAEATSEQAAEQLALVREGPRTETITAQSAVVEQARANVARAEAALSNAVITAPFGGLVTAVRIYIREDQMGLVQLGLAADIVSDTYPDRAYAGEVVFIGSEAEFTPRNVQTAEERIKLVYPVKIRITGDPDFELKPGVPADVTLRARGT
jgi:HlyD family secretion protein